MNIKFSVKVIHILVKVEAPTRGYESLETTTRHSGDDTRLRWMTVDKNSLTDCLSFEIDLVKVRAALQQLYLANIL